jgi:hypothetical protein
MRKKAMISLGFFNRIPYVKKVYDILNNCYEPKLFRQIKEKASFS